VQVAVVGVAATVVTTMGAVAVALINNRREYGGAAAAGVDTTLEERVTLRDEAIKARDALIRDLREDLEQAEARAERAERLLEALLSARRDERQ